MLATLQRKFETYNKTCPVTDIKNKSVTFIRNDKFVHYLKNIEKDAWVFAPTDLEETISKYQANGSSGIKVEYSDWPEFEFTLFHNNLYERKRNTPPHIGNGCKIHRSVIMNVDGLKVVNGPNGEKIQFIHSGHVMIGDNVEIGPYTIIHRGTMGITNIQAGCRIGSNNNIGHNCNIGHNTVIAVGAILNGGVDIGRDCWISSGAMIKHYTSIEAGSVIGMGAVVTKDITKQGIYVGNPARFLKEVGEGWNF